MNSNLYATLILFIQLVDILNTFGVLDLHRPGYSSVFMIELHQEPSSDGGNFFVELYLRNDTTKEPYKLSIPGCDFRCPLATLISKTKPIIPTDWETECQLKLPESIKETSSSTFTCMQTNSQIQIHLLHCYMCV